MTLPSLFINVAQQIYTEHKIFEAHVTVTVRFLYSDQ